VGVLLLSQGDGLSLGFDHPKGMFKPGTPANKTLIEYLANKIARVCQLGKASPWKFFSLQIWNFSL